MTGQTEIKQRIWTTIDKLRATSPFPFGDSKLLELIAATQGIEKLDSILNDAKAVQLLTRTPEFIVPPLYIFNFINDLSKSVNPKSHLDPWLTPASPCNFFDFGTTTAFCINQTAIEIIKSTFPNNKTEIHLGDDSKQLDSVKTKFDFITSFPPFGMRNTPIEINGLKTSNDFASTLLIQSSMLLDENGKAIFLISPSFLFDDRNKEVINKLGLFVDAVFAIPNGAFLPHTNIASNLIVVTKQPKQKTFIAEISSDEKSNKTILDNYKYRRTGKAIQLGVLVDFKEFKSLQALVSENEMQELVKRIGYPPIRLTEIALTTNAIKQDSKDEVEHISNSIYLPKIGNSSVVTNPSEIKMKNPKNYFQIQLDETKANSIYVANYFNSAVGKKVRESLEVGAVIPQISKSQLSNCVLHLPDVKTQLELIEIDSKIDQFSFRLDELKKNLWKQPRSYNSIAKELKSINQEDKLEDWIDTLPFPISSILWRYYATKEADGFEETRMLSPTTSSYEDGVFLFNAKELVGARTPFNEISIKSLIPLDKKKLYLAHTSQNKPVQLLPFIKFIEVSDAVYFYTSIESKNVRWVSYHFDKNPEITQPADNDLFKAFEFLKANDNKN